MYSGCKSRFWCTTTIRSKITFSFLFPEHGGIIQHIDEFISDEITQLVSVISELTNSQELNASIEMAKVLKESIEFLEVAEEPVLLEEAKVEQAKLAQKLQDALSNLHIKALESAEEIAPMAKPDALQRVSEIITHLQEDLVKAVVSGVPLVLKTAEIGKHGWLHLKKKNFCVFLFHIFILFYYVLNDLLQLIVFFFS